MIFENFRDDAELLKYLPSKPKLKSIQREFLLSVLANVRREKYAKLYLKYKEVVLGMLGNLILNYMKEMQRYLKSKRLKIFN